MKIEMRKIAEVKPYEKNPRLNDDAVDAVAASIREFGFRQPIVVDEAGVIIVGHTRLKAAQKLGLEKVPVHVATGLTPEKIKAYRLADNKLAELAEWNMDLLPLELKDLQGMDVDIKMLGFGSEELEKILGAGIHGNEGLTDPDSVPAPADEPITKPGDLWILGNHRLLCGDSSKPEDLDRLLGGAKIQLVNTDPPYNVKVEPRSNNAIAAGLSSFGEPGLLNHQGFDVQRGKSQPHGTTPKMRAKDRPLANDFMTDEAFDKILRAWFGNIARVLEPGRGFYIWGGYANCANYPSALKENELYFSQAVIWVKEHPVLTRKDFMGNHEWCQPSDTKVLTANGTSSIKSLRNGDRVVSFSSRSSAVIGLRHGLEVKTTSRHYSGPLYGVAAGGRNTWSTDGHAWTVKMTPEAKNQWCVYLMNRGGWWRVGSCKLQTTWGFGVKQRLATEDGEAAWVLSVHPTKTDAAVAEQLVSVTYGIPTTFWSESRQSRRSAAQIKGIYDKLDPDGLERGARRALRDHHRDVIHPFVTREHSGTKYGCRVPLIVRACNLLPDVMCVPIPGRAQEFSWVPIRAVDVQSYDGTVYSMAVDKHQHYIADGIITHNCFYGWREGAAHYFHPDIHNATDVWSIKKVNPQSMVHLTEKPVDLAIRAMTYSSKEGENVLDLFGGSGSTLIGAERCGRHAYLMELDMPYCDVIVKRWQDYTGKKAECQPAPKNESEEK